MNDLKKIEYYDLREEAVAGTLPKAVGRTREMERLTRVISRHAANNVLLVGPDGIGKTTLVYGWMREMAGRPEWGAHELLQLDVEHLYSLDNDYQLETQYAEALDSLPPCVLLIDDFGREMSTNQGLMQRVHRVYKNTLKNADVHIVLTLEAHEHAWLEREHPAFASAFEIIHLKSQSTAEHARILSKALPRLNARHRVIVPDSMLKEVVAYAERFPALGQTPRSAIRLLDEAISQSAATKSRVLTQDSIAHIIETKTGIPKTRLTEDGLQSIKLLEDNLNARIVDQVGAIAKITTTLQRAKLGLRNPNRPLGSFLMLGPSGVGKTETAKCVAEMMFGRSENFIRFDMSEFQQEHTVQRLIGAPAGYVGYEEGGALTGALRKEPYSLVLLDEIEKAHAKVFDVFLQVLDDGRITSGQNETVDARNAIIMATSNTAVSEILDAYSQDPDIDEESLLQHVVLPALSKTFRLEFINRFDSILVFKPLTAPSLLKIAKLEIERIEKRLAEHRVRFEIEPAVLMERISRLADPRFGARPVKRFIEETCETLLVQSMLHRA